MKGPSSGGGGFFPHDRHTFFLLVPLPVQESGNGVF